MKRIGYLYEKVIDVENCKQAIIKASQHKRNRRSVQRILDNLDFYAQDLSHRLQTNDFITPYKPKVIKDGLSGKIRNILVPSFYPDQCAHHAIVRVMQPYIIKSSYYWSCANLPNRGIDHASKGVERATKKDIKHSKYCFKCDIEKFYPSIEHNILKEKLQHKFKDKKFLSLLFLIIDTCDEGIPIGNYTSPYFAELMLQEMDNYILSFPCTRHYIRYADDIVVIGSNKRKLHKLCDALIQNLKNIKLKIKHNFQVFLIQENYVGRRIDFVGKCFGKGFTTVRKRRSLKFIRQSRSIKNKEQHGLPISYKTASGFISRSTQLLHTNTYALKTKYYNSVKINELKEIIRHYGLENCNRVYGTKA